MFEHLIHSWAHKLYDIQCEIKKLQSVIWESKVCPTSKIQPAVPFNRSSATTSELLKFSHAVKVLYIKEKQ